MGKGADTVDKKSGKKTSVSIHAPELVIPVMGGMVKIRGGDYKGEDCVVQFDLGSHLAAELARAVEMDLRAEYGAVRVALLPKTEQRAECTRGFRIMDKQPSLHRVKACVERIATIRARQWQQDAITSFAARETPPSDISKARAQEVAAEQKWTVDGLKAAYRKAATEIIAGIYDPITEKIVPALKEAIATEKPESTAAFVKTLSKRLNSISELKYCGAIRDTLIEDLKGALPAVMAQLSLQSHFLKPSEKGLLEKGIEKAVWERMDGQRDKMLQAVHQVIDNALLEKGPRKVALFRAIKTAIHSGQYIQGFADPIEKKLFAALTQVEKSQGVE